MGVSRLDVLEVVGMLLIAGAAWFLHPAASLAVLGVSAIVLANGAVRRDDDAGDQ